MRGLTRRQEDILRYIIWFTLENGFQPSIKDIGADNGGITNNAVYDNLRGIQRKGWLTMGRRSARALRLAGAAWLKYGGASGRLMPNREQLERGAQ